MPTYDELAALWSGTGLTPDEEAGARTQGRKQGLTGSLTSTPTQGAADPLRYRRLAEQYAQQQADLSGKMPDMGPSVEAYKQRSAGAGGDIATGMLLSQLGGKSGAQLGGHVLERALAARAPQQSAYGTIDQTGFTPDPFKARDLEMDRSGKLAALYEVMASHSATEEEKRRASIAAEQLRRDTMQMHQQNLAESRADRAAAREQTRLTREDALAQRSEQANWRFEDQARTHFDQITKDTRDVLNMGRALESLPENGKLSPVQQQSLVIMLNKFQDPGSVVREGEFNRVQAAQGILQKWGNLPALIATGQPLPPALVKDIRSVLREYTAAAENTMRDTGREYIRAARSRGLDPSQVVTDPRWRGERVGGAAPAAAAASPGREIDVGARLSPAAPAPAQAGRRMVDY